MEEKDVNNPEFNEEDEVVELIDEFGVKNSILSPRQHGL